MPGTSEVPGTWYQSDSVMNHEYTYGERYRDIQESGLKFTEVARSGIAEFVSILSWLPKYQKGWLRLDLVVGLTVAAVVIPQAMEADSKADNMSGSSSIMSE